jgi:signal transduction histidine kinase
MEQVLGNLVANAIRHTPPGERVLVRAVRDDGGIHLEVSDTGEGIPPAHLPRLFSRFHRVDKARTRSAGGAGLGLSIVKALVEAHGGQVRVHSELGQGSTFTCTFPPGATPLPS